MKNKSEPWKSIKGRERIVNISRWRSNGRTCYSVWVPERTPPRYTTTNEHRILEFAILLSQTPVRKLPVLGQVLADLCSPAFTRRESQDSSGANSATIEAAVAKLLADYPSLAKLKVVDLTPSVVKRLMLGQPSSNSPKAE